MRTCAGVVLFVACWMYSANGRAEPDKARPKEPVSARLAALQDKLAAGDGTALQRFWEEVEKQGTPLVEPIAEDPRHLHVTFLWRAKDVVKNVAVQIGGRPHLDKNQLQRLRDTDLWYRTYRLPNDVRCCYLLAVNSALVPLEDVPREEVLKHLLSLKRDPLNPKRETGPLVSSVLELPGAPPQPWVKKQADVPAGTLTRHTVKSALLNNERTVTVYTPPGYKKEGEPYGLLVVFDAPQYTALVPTPVILDNLIAKRAIAPLVAVLVANVKRDKELPCCAPFADFLAEELVPWVRKEYHVSSDPQRTYVAGSSYGGLAAGFAGFKHPECFGNVLSQSGSYWWKPEGDVESEWLTRQLVASPKLPVRFYLDIGLMENTPIDETSMLASNRHLRDVLQAKGYAVHYREFNGGHEYLNWRGTFADGLIALAGKDKVP